MANKPIKSKEIRCDFFAHISKDHKRVVAFLSNCNHCVPPYIRQRIQNLKAAYEKAKKNNSPKEPILREKYDRAVKALVIVARSKRQAVYAHTMARRASTPEEIRHGMSRVEELALYKWLSF